MGHLYIRDVTLLPRRFTVTKGNFDFKIVLSRRMYFQYNICILA